MWIMNKTFLIITACLLLIVGCMGVLVALSKSLGTEDVVTTTDFYLAIDDMIIESSDCFCIDFDSPLRFQVYSTCEDVDYSVTLKPSDNPTCEFYFYDDSSKKIYTLLDFSFDFKSSFEIIKTDYGFTLSPKRNSLEEILESALDEDAIVITSCNYFEPIFKVIVEDSDKNVCTFNLKMTISFKLSPEGVIF